jgi:hypothetical protein
LSSSIGIYRDDTKLLQKSFSDTLYKVSKASPGTTRVVQGQLGSRSLFLTAIYDDSLSILLILDPDLILKIKTRHLGSTVYRFRVLAVNTALIELLPFHHIPYKSPKVTKKK